LRNSKENSYSKENNNSIGKFMKNSMKGKGEIKVKNNFIWRRLNKEQVRD